MTSSAEVIYQEPVPLNPVVGQVTSDALQDNGETNYLRTPFVLLRVGSICVFDQTRGGVNPQQELLRESIAVHGLINCLDVVRLSRSAVVSYADFVGELWGRTQDISALPVSSHVPGMYDTLVAGHSRLVAIKDNEQDYAATANARNLPYNPGMAQVPAKLHAAASPIEMLAIQINENIHKAPSQERVAIALVESYYLGLRDGLWKSTHDFLKQNTNRFSRRQLHDAVAFSKLPEPARALVFAKCLPYSVGTALGDFSRVVETFYSQKYFEGRKRIELDPDERARFDGLVASKIMREATLAQTKRLNVTAARKRYENEKSTLIKASADGDTQLTLDALFKQTAKDDARQEIRHNKDEIQKLLDGMLGDQSAQFLTTQQLIRQYAEGDTLVLEQFAEGTMRIATGARRLL